MRMLNLPARILNKIQRIACKFFFIKDSFSRFSLSNFPKRKYFQFLKKKEKPKMPRKKRLSPNQLADLKSDFAGLKSITDYTPIKKEFEVAQIQPIEDALDALLVEEAQIKVQLDNVRDRIADKGNELVQKMNGAAQQIIAQYGDDSSELQAIGRKRKSDRIVGRRGKTGGNGGENGGNDTPTG